MLGTNNYQSSFNIWEDIEKDYMLTDVVEIHFLELPKFRNKKVKDYKENDIERWLMFLEKDISETTLKELINLDKAIEKAEQKIEYLSSDEETMRIYYERERSLHERANMISSAEKKAKLEIAKNLLDILDNETIAEKTGLDIEEIQALRNKNS